MDMQEPEHQIKQENKQCVNNSDSPTPQQIHTLSNPYLGGNFQGGNYTWPLICSYLSTIYRLCTSLSKPSVHSLRMTLKLLPIFAVFLILYQKHFVDADPQVPIVQKVASWKNELIWCLKHESAMIQGTNSEGKCDFNF